jgi:hypothetical protein
MTKFRRASDIVPVRGVACVTGSDKGVTKRAPLGEARGLRQERAGAPKNHSSITIKHEQRAVARRRRIRRRNGKDSALGS